MKKPIDRTSLTTLKPVFAAVVLATSSWAVAADAPVSRAGTEYVPPDVSAHTVVQKSKSIASDVVHDVKHVANKISDRAESMPARGFETPAVSRAGREYDPPSVSADDVSGKLDSDVTYMLSSEDVSGWHGTMHLPHTTRAGKEFVPPETSVKGIADDVSDAYDDMSDSLASNDMQGEGVDLPTVTRKGVEYSPPEYANIDDWGSAVDKSIAPIGGARS
ncbi:MAG: hypothetical protein GC151_12200 [Betaproteobacteria bacterium]|nr:hypothetical protein [Betaproteobacteria bacterium]